ncbi:MAG: glycosyltransferase [Verrucomicrobiota bacterium]
MLSIITPSLKNSDWLKLCVASVADQEGVITEHIVQDAGSDDGTLDWLLSDSRVKAFLEKDSGMYDAINRGFRRATGDILAYLNCDEQYLPGALKKVADYFEDHPEVDVLLADTIVVNSQGEYLCERRAMTPQLCQTLVGTTLSFLTSGLFIRRRVIEKQNLFFDTKLRDLGDLEWTSRAIRAGLQFGVLREFTSVFTDTGTNMNLLPNARREVQEIKASAPTWMRATSWFWIIHFRVRRLFSGAYICKPYEFAIFTKNSPFIRQLHFVEKPTFRWIRMKTCNSLSV